MERRFRAQERTNAIFRLEGRLEGANARAQEGSQGMRKTNARLKVRLGDSQGQEDRNQDQNLLTLGLEKSPRVLGRVRQVQREGLGFRRMTLGFREVELGQKKKRNRFRREKQIQGKNEIREEEKKRVKPKTNLQNQCTRTITPGRRPRIQLVDAQTSSN